MRGTACQLPIMMVLDRVSFEQVGFENFLWVHFDVEEV